MKKIPYSDARQNLKKVLDDAVASKEPILITRRDHPKNCVVLSEDVFTALQKDRDGATKDDA